MGSYGQVSQYHQMANKGFDVADNFNQNLFWNDFKKGIKQAAQVGRTVADTAGNIWQQVDPNSYGQVSQYHQMANKGFDVADNFNQNLFWNDIKKFQPSWKRRKGR